MKDWKDIYKMPLHKDEDSNWVWDALGNFVFQFVNYSDDDNIYALEIINGGKSPKNNYKIEYKEGYILVEGTKFILIRGWGNLTGTGAHNLSGEEAVNIQDTFSYYLVDKLKGLEEKKGNPKD